MGHSSTYGYCPICGKPGIARERRLHGNDQCLGGHIYPSSASLAEVPPAFQKPQTPSGQFTVQVPKTQADIWKRVNTVHFIKASDILTPAVLSELSSSSKITWGDATHTLISVHRLLQLLDDADSHPELQETLNLLPPNTLIDLEE